MGNTQDLSGAQAVAKLREIIDHNATCMFHTRIDGTTWDTRPMMVQQVDGSGALWYLTSKSGEAAAHIRQDPHVLLTISDNAHSEYLVVGGEASLVDDHAKKQELWTGFAKAWFPGGVDDPDLTLLRVQPTQSRYWDTTDGKVVQLLKIAGAAITGTPNNSGGVQGDLRV